MQCSAQIVCPTFYNAVIKISATNARKRKWYKTRYIFNIDYITQQEMTYSMTHLHQEASRIRRKNILPVRRFRVLDFVRGL